MVALRMNLYQEVALSFKKVGDPCSKAWYNQQRQLKLKSTTIVLKVTGNLKQNFCNNKKTLWQQSEWCKKHNQCKSTEFSKQQCKTNLTQLHNFTCSCDIKHCIIRH